MTDHKKRCEEMAQTIEAYAQSELIVGHKIRCNDLDAAAALLRECAGMGVRVKPLEWDGFVAGNYRIEVENGGMVNLWYYSAAIFDDEYPTLMRGGYITLVSVDDLKAAAQADYEARILAALEPAPGYLDGWNDAMELAAEKAKAEQTEAQDNLDQLHSEGFGPKTALDIRTGRLVAAQELRAAIRALTPPERTKGSLANKLPREIARVTAKKERWQGYMRDHDMGPGMQISINIMQAEIENAVAALASGDVTAMLAALEALKGYNDAD
jgi:hypothetical protein